MPARETSPKPRRRRPCWAIILAGGSGKRLGKREPKPFVTLADRPLLSWSILAFARHRAVTDVLVVVPRGWSKALKRDVIAPLENELAGLDCTVHPPVVGGRRRQDSARAGIEAARLLTPAETIEDTPVLIHDAARPIVLPAMIDELLACVVHACRAEPGVAGAIPVLPVGDTLKTLRRAPSGTNHPSHGRVLRTVPRAGLWQVQTPQAFCLGPLLEAHEAAFEAEQAVTDDAMIYEWMGWPVETIPGTPLNIKVTYPEDLALLEAWLQASGGEGLATRPRIRIREEEEPGNGLRARAAANIAPKR